MIEYIFFNATLRDAFVEYARSLGITCILQNDAMGLVVEIPENISEELTDALEAIYDNLQEKQSQLLTKEQGGLKQLAGFHFNLPGGQPRMVPLQIDIANRLMAGFSLAEIQAMFEAVALSALNPLEDHLCKVLAKQALLESKDHK